MNKNPSTAGYEGERHSFLSILWGLRSVISFWWLGLCNNYGYVVMLSAAHDILQGFDIKDNISHPFNRDCNSLSTGIILLADIVPSILVKILAPFLPLKIFIRMAAVILLSTAGFILVASKLAKWAVIMGVICTSLSCGLGETTLLSYIVFFPTHNVLSTWSSGTGAAGLLGAGSYVALTALGLSSTTSIWLMLIVPIIQAVCFVFFIEHPKTDLKIEGSEIPTKADTMKWQDKMKIMPLLLTKYMMPFGFVYLFEYFINQGLFELLYFPDSFLDHHSQYRIYQFLYQSGVLISRSSMNLVKIDWLWIMAVLQLVNVALFTFEVLFGFIYYLVIMMLLVVWEGLIGGCSYVNTYRRINSEMERDQRQYSMAICGLADAMMIMLAGVLASPVHNALCDTSKPYPYSNGNVSHELRATFIQIM